MVDFANFLLKSIHTCPTGMGIWWFGLSAVSDMTRQLDNFITILLTRPYTFSPLLSSKHSIYHKIYIVSGLECCKDLAIPGV